MAIRTANLNFTADAWETLIQQTEAHKAHDALAYLTVWALASYAHVTVYISTRDPEMVAIYRKQEGEAPGYTIGAVWHDDHFGFHS